MAKKKDFVPMRIAPLQRITAEPITDPTEQAALDKLRKRRKAKPTARRTPTNSKGAKAARSSTSKKRA
jgi:hypothetical protein